MQVVPDLMGFGILFMLVVLHNIANLINNISEGLNMRKMEVHLDMRLERKASKKEGIQYLEKTGYFCLIQ